MTLAQSKKLSQLTVDNAQWEDRQLLRSGAVRGTELQTEFDDGDVWRWWICGGMFWAVVMDMWWRSFGGGSDPCGGGPFCYCCGGVNGGGGSFWCP